MAKVWLVTGSSRGLGRALAETVLDAGDLLVATARNPAQLNNRVAQYGQDRVLAVPLDVTDPSSASAAIAACIAKFGRLDVLVNNAGYAAVAAVEDMSLMSFSRADRDQLFFGVVHVTKAAIPTLRQQGPATGHVHPNLFGRRGRAGSPGLAAYQSSKWAVGGFSAVLGGRAGAARRARDGTGARQESDALARQHRRGARQRALPRDGAGAGRPPGAAEPDLV